MRSPRPVNATVDHRTVQMDTDNPFAASDSPDFREIVGLLLARGAARLRSLEPVEYVKQCRKAWSKVRTDKFYSRKILMDEVVSGNGTDLYCAAFAEIHVETNSSGTQWKEPTDYLVRRKPLGRHRREVIFVYPTGALRPEPDVPQASIQVVALFDLLGFEAKLKDVGLASMYAKYQEIIHRALMPSVAQDKYSVAAGMFAGELREGYLKLPIRYAYFSDTLLTWVPLHNAFVGTFLDRCSSLFCNALEMGFPLRGAISVGEVVFHKKTNTYLGEPLVEAARLEAAQNALGVALGASVRDISFPPNRVQRYDPPVKAGKEPLLSGLALDWPRFWRDFRTGSPVEKLLELRVSNFSKYYDNAIEFVRYSDENRNWFVGKLEAQIGPFQAAKAV